MKLHYHLRLSQRNRLAAQYALEVLLEGIGVYGEPVDDPARADLIYAPEPIATRKQGALWIQADAHADWTAAPTGWTWFEGIPLAYQFLRPRGRAGTPTVISADVLYSTFALITGQQPVPNEVNAWGVPLVTPGEGEDANPFYTRPVIAEYVQAIANRLAWVFGTGWRPVPRWPEGKRYAVVLSHDVDRPFAWPTNMFYTERFVRDVKDGAWRKAMRGLPGLLRRRMRGWAGLVPPPDTDPHFGFAWWKALESSLGATSCFYVAVTRASEPGAAFHDVDYDASTPIFREAMFEAVRQGWEIGLHASINAWKRPEQFAEEKARLERLLNGMPVGGVRHHHWSLQPGNAEATWRAHQAAGFLYDSSLGINDGAGFQRSMCWPFQPWDAHRQAKMPIMQIPPTLMDGGIFYQPVTPEEGKHKIEAHLDDVRAVRGAVVLDWHLEQSHPQRLQGAGPLLASVLAERAGSNEIYWTSPLGLTKWWQARRKQLVPTRQRIVATDRQPRQPTPAERGMPSTGTTRDSAP